MEESTAPHTNSVDPTLRQRGFGGTLGFGERPLLCVIDMMVAFTNPDLPFGAKQDATIRAIGVLLDAFHQAHLPVVFTQVQYDEQDATDAGLWSKKMSALVTLRPNTPETAIDPRLPKEATDIVMVKKYASAFFGTDLVARLNARRIDTLVLAGCTTSGCIRATAVDAIQYGFRPMIVREAVADRSAEAHRQSLLDLQAKYADVLSLAEALSSTHTLTH